jgi:hypothetical protein
VQAELGGMRATLGDEVFIKSRNPTSKHEAWGLDSCFDSILTASDWVLLMHGSSGFYDY